MNGKLKDITIVSYNVHGGIKSKLAEYEFHDFLRKADIIILSETHLENGNYPELIREWEFEVVDAVRRESKGRASGGMVVGFKKELNKMCKIINRSNGIFLELIHQGGKIAIIPVYLSFGKWEEEFERLYDLITEIRVENMMIIGDLNGRIGEHGSKRLIRNNHLKEVRKSKDKRHRKVW